jgi:hypothetical protein
MPDARRFMLDARKKMPEAGSDIIAALFAVLI